MNEINPYCTTNVGLPISFATLIILVVLCFKFKFSQKYALLVLVLMVCLAGQASILSMVIVCSDYYLFHLGTLILIQGIILGLWYNDMLVLEVRTVTTDNIV